MDFLHLLVHDADVSLPSWPYCVLVALITVALLYRRTRLALLLIFCVVFFWTTLKGIQYLDLLSGDTFFCFLAFELCGLVVIGFSVYHFAGSDRE